MWTCLLDLVLYFGWFCFVSGDACHVCFPWRLLPIKRVLPVSVPIPVGTKALHKFTCFLVRNWDQFKRGKWKRKKKSFLAIKQQTWILKRKKMDKYTRKRKRKIHHHHMQQKRILYTWCILSYFLFVQTRFLSSFCCFALLFLLYFPSPAFLSPSPIFTVRCSIFKSQKTNHLILTDFFFQQANQWTGWECTMMTNLRGATLGLLP